MGCLNSNQASKHQAKNQPIQVGSRKIIRQNIIAQGAYGVIWKCLEPQTNQIFALKIIRLQTPQLQKMFQKQVRVLTVMKNNRAKHVIQIIQSAKYFYPQTSPIGCILLEFSHMSLYEELNNKRFSSQQTTKILLQILSGLEELHTANIYHLDIKPQNIIYCKEGYKICDLGSCIQQKINFSQINKNKRAKIQEFIESNSTLMYRSPQMIDTTNKILDEKTDVWMLGLIGYMMMYRKHPFENQGKTAVLSPIYFPSEGSLQRVLQGMLRIDYQARLSCKQARKQLETLQF